MSGGYCIVCGRPAADPNAHTDCHPLVLDPPSFCAHCGKRLDVQVLPTGYRASCRRCERVHPARRRR